MPGERADLGVRTSPPDDAQLEEMKQSGSCPLDAREVKLVDLLRGENPMFVKVDADQLIPLGDGLGHPLDVLAYGARVCTRAIGCPTSERSPH